MSYCAHFALLRINKAIALPIQLSNLTRNYAKKDTGGTIISYFHRKSVFLYRVNGLRIFFSCKHVGRST